jgi:site-specific recombinase XerC
MSEIEQAKQVLIAEREAVLAGLAQERIAAERAAEEQRRWRADVQALLERGRSAGLSVAEMADALGISRQWTNHLAKQAVDKELRKRAAALPPGFRPPPPAF